MVIGLGSDIVSVRRMEKIVSRRPAFAGRVLTGSENSVFIERHCSAEFLSGRFAAKEAVLKAFGTGLRNGLLFNEIEITVGPLGEPVVSLNGRAREIFDEIGGRKVLISISHEKDYAVAVALIEG